jgi:hypothetical protein
MVMSAATARNEYLSALYAVEPLEQGFLRVELEGVRVETRWWM